jgi:hypothetical protein
MVAPRIIREHHTLKAAAPGAYPSPAFPMHVRYKFWLFIIRNVLGIDRSFLTSCLTPRLIKNSVRSTRKSAFWGMECKTLTRARSTNHQDTLWGSIDRGESDLLTCRVWRRMAHYLRSYERSCSLLPKSDAPPCRLLARTCVQS